MSHQPRWGVAIIGVSLLLAAVTPLSYGLAGQGALSTGLFWLGLGGDGNVGAWWSGTLFLLAAVFALDRSAQAERTATERRGWAALAAALALLSLDEIAMLHEFLSRRGLLYLVPLGLVGLGLVAYSLRRLDKAGVSVRKLLIGFGLLATVPAQELVQETLQWSNPWVYGVRALIEEGTEIAAALTLISATSGGLWRLRVGEQTFASLAWLGLPLVWLALGSFPLVAAAVYPLNLPGVANWLGATLFLACALLAMRSAALRRQSVPLLAASLYLLASLGSNAVRPDWDPLVLGQQVNLRGVFFGSLLLAAPWILAAGQPWHRRAFWFALAGCTWFAAFVLLRPQALWSTWPPTLALLCFYIEISASVRLRAAVARVARPPALPTAATTPKVPPLLGPL